MSDFDVDQLDQMKNIKAELVRNKLLSRKELMNQYRLPMKKNLLPGNNPFVNKTILDPISVPARPLFTRNKSPQWKKFRMG